MEPWKIGVIAAMFAGLVGFGLYNQSVVNTPPTPGPGQTPAATATPSRYMGMTIGSSNLPEWSNITKWVNTPAPVKLSSFKGKTALIEIFRIDCPHCQDAAPFMEALYNRYKPRGLEVVAIQSPGNTKDPQNEENDWNAVKTWISKNNLKYPIGFDEKSGWFQGKVSKVPEQTFYPTLMVVDKTGTVQFAQTGHDEAKAISLTVAIEKALPSSKSVEERAADLAQWLTEMLHMASDPAMKKALTDDLAQRIKQ